MSKINSVIAVIFGGVSNENEISVITGTMACNILKSKGKNVLPVYIDVDGAVYADTLLSDISVFKRAGYKKASKAIIADGGAYIKNAKGKIKSHIQIEVALNCCHGGYGEGGGLNGVFALADIPFAGANLFESAAFMDKYYTKLVLSSLGVKTAEYALITAENDAFSAVENMGFPVIVKPCRLGSSIGISKADDSGSLENAVKVALEYDDKVIIERYLPNRREINCAVYFSDEKIITSPCEEAVSSGELLSYGDKYAGGGKSHFPADIPDLIANKVRLTTAEVYAKLHMRGIARFDYILSDGEIYLSEINTVPGSLSYYLLSEGFSSFYSVLQAVIAQAMRDYAENAKKLILKTGILNNFSANTCKRGAK